MKKGEKVNQSNVLKTPKLKFHKRQVVRTDSVESVSES